MSNEDEQTRQRKANLEAIVALGFAAYPNKFDTTHTVSQLVDAHTATSAAVLENPKIETVAAGRVVGIRSFGKAAFLVISDGRQHALLEAAGGDPEVQLRGEEKIGQQIRKEKRRFVYSTTFSGLPKFGLSQAAQVSIRFV